MVHDAKRKSTHWAAKCKFEFSRARCGEEVPLELTDEEQNEEELQKLERFFNVSRESDASLAVSFATMAFCSLSRAAGAPAEERAPEDGESESMAAVKGASRWKWHALKWKSDSRASSKEPPGGPPGGGVGGDGTTPRAVPRRSGLPALPPPTAAAAPPPADHPLSATFRGWEEDIEEFNLALQEEGEGGDARKWVSQGAAQLRRKIHRPVSSWELSHAKNPVPITIADFKPLIPRRPHSPGKRHESHYDLFTREIPTQSPEHRRAMQLHTETIRKSYFSPAAPSEAGSPLAGGSNRFGMSVASRPGTRASKQMRLPAHRDIHAWTM